VFLGKGARRGERMKEILGHGSEGLCRKKKIPAEERVRLGPKIGGRVGERGTRKNLITKCHPRISPTTGKERRKGAKKKT